MDQTIKEDFYRPMYCQLDSSDDEVDSFSDFRGEVSSKAPEKLVATSTIGSRELLSSSPANNTPTTISRGLLSSSPVRDVATTQDHEEPPLPAHLQKNYISSPVSFNQWLKLSKKKDMVVAKSSKLRGYVLLYWPPCPNAIPRKNRRGSFASVIEHGGTLAKEWDNGYCVTHIVVDSTGKGREYKDVLENLKLESIPDGIQLVTAGWVDDKISPRWGPSNSSENRFRVFGYSESSSSSQDAGLLAKKRTMSNAPANSKVKRAKIQDLQSPPKHTTNVETGLNIAIVNGDNESKQQSPKLMKQHQPLNFGVRLGMRALRSNVPVELDKNNLDVIMQSVQKAQDDRDIRELMQRGSAASELTANGKNIDRIFESALDETDLAYESEESDEEPSLGKAKGFLCAKKNLRGNVEKGPNAGLIEQLKCLAAHYATKKDDMFRAKGYREAISVIRKQKHSIVTKEQALKLPRVGSSIATKIGEFGKQGSIDLVTNFAADPRELAIKLFTGIYGVGQRTAEEWYNAGIRTLDQLKDTDLHDHQRIGLEHYDDFNSRIPRDEVTLHAECVTQVAEKVNKHLEIVVGGSYRRGQADSGDVDFLITASDSHVSNTHLRKMVFEQLIPALKTAGYIRADLTVPSESKESSKWMGAACLPDSKTQIWRRVDILVVPNAEWGAALLYFTGNDIFNRSMRLLARRGGGSLNQRGLFKGVIRGKDGVKIAAGTLVEGRDERKIFEVLGVKWRPPYERCP